MQPTSDIIHRPDPGLARGLWETTPGTLYLALAVVLLSAALYVAFRLGLFTRLRRRAPAPRP